MTGRKEIPMFYGANPILFEFAKQLRKYETSAEKLLWEHLSNKQLGVRFRRQHPVKYFIADFYCHEKKLVIEADGGVHLIPAQYEYDQNRDYELLELGVKVLRFTNDETVNSIDQVIISIKENL